MMAFVRGVSAAATCSGSRLKVVSSMSTSTGFAPRRAMAPAVAKNEYVDVTTSSPALDIERHQREQQRVGARRHRDGVAHAEHPRHLFLERGDLGAHDEPLAVADALDRRENLRAKRDVLRMQIEQRHFQGHARLFYRLDLMAARVSRSASRRRSVSRLSYSFLPLASATATLTRPFLK